MVLSLKDNKEFLVIRATDLGTGGVLPTEIMITPFGEWKGFVLDGEKIEFEVSKQLAQQCVDYHRMLKDKFPTRDLVIDYEHQTNGDGEAPAAGWLYMDLFLKEDGMWGKVKEFTKKAADRLMNREYRYASPTLIFNGLDKVTGQRVPMRVKNIGLTNEPFLDSYKPIMAKDSNEATIIFLNSPTPALPEGEGDGTGTNNKGDIAMNLEKILALFGLAKDATFEVVEQKFNDMKTGMQTVAAKYKSAMTELALKEDASVDDVKAFALKHNAILQELGVKATDSLDSIKAVIVSAKDKGTGQQIDLKDYVKKSEFTALEVQLKERDAKDILNRHAQRGALAKHEEEDYLNDVKTNKIELKDMDARLTKRPDYSIVPLKEIEAKDITSQTAGITNEDVEMGKKLGVDKSTLEKYGKK